SAAPGAQSYVAEAGRIDTSTNTRTLNTGTVTFSRIEVVDPGHPDYVNELGVKITFQASGDPAQPWEIVFTDTDDNAIAGLPPQPFVSGEAIEFAGLRITLEGEPAVGDVINVQPAQLDLF